MATGSGGSKVRIIVLVVLLAAVAAAGWYKFGRGGLGGGVETTVINGDLVGKHLDDVTTALASQPVEQPNPDAEKSTAKIYLYTLTGARADRQFVRVRVAADGRVLYTRYVDASGNEVIIDKK